MDPVIIRVHMSIKLGYFFRIKKDWYTPDLKPFIKKVKKILDPYVMS